MAASSAATGVGRVPPVRPQWVREVVTGVVGVRLMKEADLPPIRLHDLRHGAATLALAGGANLKVVSEMLGQSTCDHRRHLHQRAARARPGSRRGSGPAGAPQDVGRTSRPHFGPIWRSTTAARGVAGDETAGQRRAWDSNPRNESPRSAVFKTAAIGL